MTNKIYFNETLYKREAGLVAASIFAFIFLYLLLFAFTIALAVCAAWLGGAIMFAKLHWITLGIGVSLILFGLFIIYFMVKFLFVSQDETDPYRVEITPQEQPDLFKLIEEIALKAGSEKPSKVFLSHRVNACVFYNSFTFWSLLFPVRKNLEIGIGLFNSLNVSELSSIIAHEFGHFNQNSMKLGPYVYHANRVIYNMLYDNQSWETTVKNIGEQHWLMTIFMGLSLGYANAVKSIMQKVYELINVRYLALSRQMEFHADSIAVEICGSLSFSQGMLKLEWVDTAMNETLDTVDSLLKKNQKGENLFELQGSTLQQLLSFNSIKQNGGAIELTNASENKNHFRQRVKIQDQWASHPPNTERIENAAALNIERPINTLSSWTLLRDSSSVQRTLTQHLYTLSNITATDNVTVDEFTKVYHQRLYRYQYPAAYNTYYNNRSIEQIDLDNPASNNTTRNPFEELFPKITVTPAVKLRGLLADVELLKSIEESKVNVKYFDFDGEKQEAHQAFVFRKKLEDEMEQIRADLKISDKWVYDYVCFAAPYAAADLKAKYQKIQDLDKVYNEFNMLYMNSYNAITTLYADNRLDVIAEQVENFKSIHLKEIAAFLKALRHTGGLLRTYPEDDFERKLSGFLNQNYTYFAVDTIYSDNFNHLLDICFATLEFINHCIVTAQKDMAEFQLTSLNITVTSSNTGLQAT